MKVLLYAESVGMVTSGHVTKTAVKPSIRHSGKPHAIRKLYGCIFYRTEDIAD